MFLLGQHEEAIGYLKQAVSALFDAAGEVETGYAVSSLAQVYLRTGSPARRRSRREPRSACSAAAKTRARRSATSSSSSDAR